ncbi:Rv1733c family protein [Geodermatophilus marinus]|uniref:Rv1733c family protein n=1 Tax=Geodermatophilus sp. LHW52908 TaxID=2303986 RepID=UPI000E3D6AA5|nr:hypothetical protein [Geodermatophilus sp. LHW52908]RFU19681.1 hypothetical protein D0Z06_20125 [Geodermatophilus sp. LHW52908]
MAAQHESFARRSLRRCTLGSGPLRRRSDRVQVVGRLVVVLSFLVAPVAAVAASTATAAHLHAVAAAEAAERFRARAVVLEEAPGPAHPRDGAYGTPPGTVVPVRVAWTAPDGRPREGFVPVQRGTPVGTAVRLWVDRDGDLAPAPLDRSSIPDRAAAAGALPLLALPLATWALHALLTSVLDARRERAWEAEWAAVEPGWSSRPR